jgi:hypothetical protein
VESSIHGSIGTIDIRDTMQGKIRVAAKPGVDAARLSIDSIHIGGSLLGGTSSRSGSIEAPNIDLLTIDGGIFGGAGDDTGGILATNLSRVIVHGSIVGGTGLNTAVINANTIDSATVDGSLVGTSGFASARLVAGTISKVRIGGDIIGSDGDFSGQARPNFLGDIRIGGDVVGGSGVSSGQVGANDVDSVIIGGSVVGGKGAGSGTISANTIDVVRIAGDLVAGAGDVTGRVVGGGHIRFIGGSILGRVPDSGDVSLGAGLYASIFSIDQIRIGGDVISANIVTGVSPGADKQFGTPDDNVLAPPTASITSLRIGGHVAGPSTASSFGIEANAIGKVKIGGVSFTDGVGNVDFSNGILVDPQGTIKLRTLA